MRIYLWIYRLSGGDQGDAGSLLQQQAPELEAHLSEVLLSITPWGRPVYEGILRAGPSGITINALASITGKDAHSMGSRPTDLERQHLVKTLHHKGNQKVKLTRFRGHRTVCVQGVHDGQDKIALCT
jgi:hypothetical protein